MAQSLPELVERGWKTDTECTSQEFHVVPVDNSRFRLVVIPDLLSDRDTGNRRVFDDPLPVESISRDYPATAIEHRGVPRTGRVDSQWKKVDHVPDGWVIAMRTGASSIVFA